MQFVTARSGGMSKIVSEEIMIPDTWLNTELLQQTLDLYSRRRTMQLQQFWLRRPEIRV